MQSMSLVAMLGIGPPEMLVVCIVGLLLFGNRVPEAMRGIGRGLKEFKDGVRGIETDLEKKEVSS